MRLFRLAAFAIALAMPALLAAPHQTALAQVTAAQETAQEDQIDAEIADGEMPADAVPVETQAQPAARPAITDEAQRIWDKFGGAIYQVQVIDENTTSKNSIGSGFQFTKDGLMGTNYHVVSSAIQHPGKARLEFLHDNGRRGALKVLIVDVVHDLAILKMDTPGETYVDLGHSRLPKGARLFSLGNPLDVGFTIIEGTNNGASKETFIDKIHFSGALNPGMSGGPVLGHDGKVVGVNVATAGNSVSFLVPVEPLHMLVAEQAKLPAGYDFPANASRHIEEQLLRAQQKVSDKLLSPEPWKKVGFGFFEVPGRIDPAFKCWGNTYREEKQPYKEYAVSDCQIQDRLFLDEGFDTGTLSYRFEKIVAADKLTPTRFYSYYQSKFAGGGYGFAREEDVTNYDCNTRFIDQGGQRWKAAFCVRRYKKYPQLYDIEADMALIGNLREGMLASLSIQGFAKDNALKLAQRFMSEIAARDPRSPAPPAPLEQHLAPKNVSEKAPDMKKPGPATSPSPAPSPSPNPSPNPSSPVEGGAK